MALSKTLGSCFSKCIISFTVFISFANAQAPSNYYNSVVSSSANQLRSTLHPVIDDHTRYPYTSSSTDTWDILESADEDADNSGRVTTIYKNASYAKQGGGNNSYNREHSWPKSLGFPRDGSSNYPYTDAHHLFIADVSYNSSRSNKFFDNCNAGCNRLSSVSNDGVGGVGGSYPGDSNWTDSSGFEVWSERKGDIARAMFYMDIRYEGGNHNVTGYSEPDLRLTDNIALIENSSTGSNASVAYMGLLSTLIEWHLEDPVSADEIERNDVVFAYQGNRNPFVDHPEWVLCLYQDQCGGGTPPPSSNELNSGDTVTGLSASTGNWLYYIINVPAGASDLNIAINGGSGDADLYTRFGSQPTTSSYNCRPYRSGNSESCTVSVPSAGTYHIGVRAYSSFSNVSLTASYSTGSSGGVQPETEVVSNISGSQGQWRNYSVTIPAGATNLSASITGGSGDADIYVRRGQLPTLSTYECRPWLTGNNESCSVNNPSSGTWYISIYGYSAYSGVTLEYSYE